MTMEGALAGLLGEAHTIRDDEVHGNDMFMYQTVIKPLTFEDVNRKLHKSLSVLECRTYIAFALYIRIVRPNGG